jgi:hypothetical protein
MFAFPYGTTWCCLKAYQYYIHRKNSRAINTGVLVGRERSTVECMAPGLEKSILGRLPNHAMKNKNPAAVTAVTN